jgi:aspartyl-tRNA(Asn)/glutamyl-tRNA(Gln) amidotransferase subunit A
MTAAPAVASDELAFSSLAGAAALLRAGKVSPVELVHACLARIESQNPVLNAFVTVTAESALREARAAEAEMRRGEWRGPLHGIPMAIKDMIDTRGVRTTGASAVYLDRIPEADAAVVSRLRRAGAILLGKLNMQEFAIGGSSVPSHFGPVRNPWDPSRIAGGSSGGSAAAVAAGLCFAALGTDTGGSVRQPAALCGIVGLKPTYGRCSRWGIVAFASSLDQAGPFARSVRDCAILLRSMAGPDPKDTTCVDRPVPDYEKAVGASAKGMRIGIPKEYRVSGMATEIETLWQQGVQWLKDAGAETVDISLPMTKYALPAYYIVAPAEASSNLARYDGVRYGLRAPGRDVIDMYEHTRRDGFGKEVRRRIMIGTYVLSAGYYDAYYMRAQKVRTLIKRDFERSFADGIDAILTPTTPSAAFGIGEKGRAGPIEMYLNDVFTVTVNMAGLPGISVPSGLDAQGLPLGLQLIGRPFEEETLFALGSIIEQAAGSFQTQPWWR